MTLQDVSQDNVFDSDFGFQTPQAMFTDDEGWTKKVIKLDNLCFMDINRLEATR